MIDGLVTRTFLPRQSIFGAAAEGEKSITLQIYFPRLNSNPPDHRTRSRSLCLNMQSTTHEMASRPPNRVSKPRKGGSTYQRSKGGPAHKVSFESGDAAVFITCDMGREGKCAGEVLDLFTEVSFLASTPFVTDVSR